MTDSNNWLPRIDQTLCTGCGDCITQCPTGALAWEGSKAGLVYPKRCIYCATCEDICPVNAIELPYLIVKRAEKAGNHE